MAAKIDRIETFEKSLKELYCVSNSGECGYIKETFYFTRKKDAFGRVSYWLDIGDMANVSIINVAAEVYKTIQEVFCGHIRGADFYEILSEEVLNG